MLESVEGAEFKQQLKTFTVDPGNVADEEAMVHKVKKKMARVD